MKIMEEQDKVKVLCIFPSSVDKQNLLCSEEYKNGRVEFFLMEEGRINYGATSDDTDLHKVFEDCCRIIEQNNISVVVSTRDVADLVHAKLVERFPSLRGPKLLPCLLACNKYYTRKLLDPDSDRFRFCEFLEIKCDNVNEKFNAHDRASGTGSDHKKALWTGGNTRYSPAHSPAFQEKDFMSAEKGQHLRALATEFVNRWKINLPIYCKPAIGSGSCYAKLVENVEDALELLQKGPKYLKRYTYIGNFFNDSDIVKEYQLEKSNGYLLEHFVNPCDVLTELTLDGFVFDGKIYHWCLTDCFKWSGKPSSICFWSTPSILSQKLQQELWDKYDQIVSRLISYGFDNQFVMIEFFVMKDETIKLIEVNTRMGSIYYLLYQECYSGDDLISAAIKIARGVKPTLPERTGKFGAVCLLKTYEIGKTAGDILDFGLCCKEEDIVLFVEEGKIIEDCGEGGFHLGVAYVFGNNLDELKKANLALYRRLFKVVEAHVQLEEKHSQVI